MLADRPRARIPQGLQVRLAVRHVAAARLLCLRRIRGVKIPLLRAEAQVEQQRPVSAPRERAGNQRAGGEGYVPFGLSPPASTTIFIEKPRFPSVPQDGILLYFSISHFFIYENSFLWYTPPDPARAPRPPSAPALSAAPCPRARPPPAPALPAGPCRRAPAAARACSPRRTLPSRKTAARAGSPRRTCPRARPPPAPALPAVPCRRAPAAARAGSPRRTLPARPGRRPRLPLRRTLPARPGRRPRLLSPPHPARRAPAAVRACSPRRTLPARPAAARACSPRRTLPARPGRCPRLLSRRTLPARPAAARACSPRRTLPARPGRAYFPSPAPRAFLHMVHAVAHTLSYGYS